MITALLSGLCLFLAMVAWKFAGMASDATVLLETLGSDLTSETRLRCAAEEKVRDLTSRLAIANGQLAEAEDRLTAVREVVG